VNSKLTQKSGLICTVDLNTTKLVTKLLTFYRASYALAVYAMAVCPSVCPSVRLSQVGILLKIDR